MGEYESDISYNKKGNLQIIILKTVYTKANESKQWSLHEEEKWAIVRTELKLGCTFQITVELAITEKEEGVDICYFVSEIYLNRMGE